MYNSLSEIILKIHNSQCTIILGKLGSSFVRYKFTHVGIQKKTKNYFINNLKMNKHCQLRNGSLKDNCSFINQFGKLQYHTYASFPPMDDKGIAQTVPDETMENDSIKNLDDPVQVDDLDDPVSVPAAEKSRGTGEIESNTNKYTLRTHTCGELGVHHVGQKVKLMGWLEFNRMNKFLLLRDSYGRTQLIIPDSRSDLQTMVKSITLESVISIIGTVCFRPSGQENPRQKTGAIEVSVTDLKVLNKAINRLPFYIRDFQKPLENICLKYRYLYLRFDHMQHNLRVRSKILHKMRRFLIEHLNFVEIETPTLFKRTPGGAQEFVVPTQVKGKFFSLVQSPQQFKQLLMVGSMDRYFQIAHCYRDETSRSDRQPEFTQLDIEMSFCKRENIINLIEDLLKYCWPEHLPALATPFPQLTYDEVMNSYGTDKPDLRFDWKLENLSEVFYQENDDCNGKFNANKFLENDNFAAYAFVGRKGAVKFSDHLKISMQKEICTKHPDTGFLFIPIKSIQKVKGKLEELFSCRIAQEIEKITKYKAGDVLFFAIGKKQDVLTSLGRIRVFFAEYLEDCKIDIIQKNTFKFAWIFDFPLFELKEGIIKSAHHPFTRPHPQDCHLLDTAPLQVRGLHYDLVLNGQEVGGGSIRVEDCELQKKILKEILNINLENLSHLLQGLESGAPPHGGIALGIDRLIAILCNAHSIRDVMAFPKSTSGSDIMSGSPSDITAYEKQLYHIKY